MMAEQNPFAEFPDIELADTMCQLAGGISAIHAQLLAMAAEYDRRKAWRDDGAPDMSSWLCIRLGLAYRTGKEWTRVAHALDELPECARVYSEGRLSWDQLRPLTLITTPETDAEQAAAAPGASAAALEVAVRRTRRVELAEAEEQQNRRHLRWWWQGNEGFRLSGRLPAADGATLVAALERFAAQQPDPEVTPLGEAYASRMADALMGLAAGQPTGDPHADRACVVVHVDAATLAGDGEGKAHLDGGHPVHPEIARRLVCDGRLEMVIEGRGRVPVGVGRARRTVPGWLWRLLVHRDAGRCRFCGCTRYLDAHHIVWWSRGGRTDLDNLILLDSRCHKLFHEGGWTMEGNANGELIFRRPDGRALPNGPPALRPQVGRALETAIGFERLAG